MPRAEIVFCGKSLYLSGLASGLQSGGRFRVIRLESALGQIAEELKMLHPDAVVFELDATSHHRVIMDFLKTHPRIRLIGLNPDDDSLTVFSGNGRWTASVQELGPVIMEEDCLTE